MFRTSLIENNEMTFNRHVVSSLDAAKTKYTDFNPTYNRSFYFNSGHSKF